MKFPTARKPVKTVPHSYGQEMLYSVSPDRGLSDGLAMSVDRHTQQKALT
jgi:hypothetical protein